MPEWALDPYQRMLPRIQAERARDLANVLLATNDRAMSDEDRRGYQQEIANALAGGRTAHAVPRITPDLAARLGATLRPPADD